MTCRATPISPSQIKALAALKKGTTERSSQMIYILVFALLKTTHFKKAFHLGGNPHACFTPATSTSS